MNETEQGLSLIMNCNGVRFTLSRTDIASGNESHRQHMND